MNGPILSARATNCVAHAQATPLPPALAAHLAAHLGVTLASAQTYVKRTCRKLGVAGQRELLAWLMEPTAHG